MTRVSGAAETADVTTPVVLYGDQGTNIEQRKSSRRSSHGGDQWNRSTIIERRDENRSAFVPSELS
jgi:hypothetical protein